MTDPLSAHNQFLLDDNLTYLNHAAIGPMPKNTYEILQSVFHHLSEKGSASIDFERMENNWENIRIEVAELLNGSPDGVVVTSDTTSGLHMTADILHPVFNESQNIVISDLEFTANSYIWQRVADRYNLELRTAKYSSDSKDLEGWENIIDDGTGLVSVSHVQFSNGLKVDLEYLSRLAHDHGSLISVDAIQSLGALPFDTMEWDIDFVSAGGYKWLLGPHGTGIFYVNPEIIERFPGVLVGWFGDKKYHESMQHHKFDPWDDARQYQRSHFLTGALLESIKLINSWGPTSSIEHIIKLQNHLIESIEYNDNYTVASNLNDKKRSGIIKIDHPDAENIVKKLQEEDIIVSYREGGIRIAPHAYNTLDDIDRLITNL